MKFTFFLILLLLSYLSFGQQKDSVEFNKMTVGCIVVKKDFIKKNGESAGFGELYLRCSVQDYFIKFCESKVKFKEIEKYIDKGITVDIEIINGNWDICEDDPQEMQSRIGYYAVINKITPLSKSDKKTKGHLCK